MSPTLRFPVILFALLCSALPARAAPPAALERGAAIIDPAILRELDGGHLGLFRLLQPERSFTFPSTGGVFFAMAPVRSAIDAEFQRYIARHKAAFPAETIGVGESFDVQLFDRSLLYGPNTRFVLAGIVNRMDRAYVSAASCGEIRLIYRLTLANAPLTGENAVSQRLPVTLNVVLKAKGELPISQDWSTINCAEIARRWLAAGELSLTGAELGEKLTATGGPLDLIGYQDIDRIETNIQIAHAPKSAVRDFRTDYLLKVFNYNAQARRFEEAPMENQIDRERILADENLRRDFK